MTKEFYDKLRSTIVGMSETDIEKLNRYVLSLKAAKAEMKKKAVAK